MSKTLVLDFGGVVTRTLFETHRETEAALGLPGGSLTWRGPFDPDNDALWRDMIADKITERHYWMTRTKEVAQMIGQTWTSMQEFVIAARSQAPMEIIRPEFLAIFKTARSQGIRLAVLSNELDLFYGADFRDKLPFLADFEVIIDATYTKILKPDPRSYDAVCVALNLPPDQCVFVDDQVRNIKGAQDFGMETVHFDVRNPAASYAEALEKLGDKTDG
jgi:putative hydrolase of the HAD superfamily